MNTQVLTWVLTFLGLLGFYLAGKKVWWCWYINIANQLVWILYSVTTKQWAFLVGTAFYMYVFTRNAYIWTKEHNKQEETVYNEYDPGGQYIEDERR